ncbi:MAG: hemolysin family protein [Eubacterium sp.]|nr:hemolysin family protein [Eubacterium sp.]
MPQIVGQILLQVVLILLNAFFAATEIAVISLNEKKLKARADKGEKKAIKMMKMIESPTQFLSTIQIGITLAGFLGSAFAADNFAEKLSGAVVKAFNISADKTETINTVSVILITLILSYFTLVLGELVPKRVAMKHKEKLAEAVCGTITGLSIILKPIIWLLTISTNGVVRLFGIDPNENEEPVSEEDIVLMLDAGADQGNIDKTDLEYIKNVFKLDGVTAEDVMTPKRDIVMLPQDASSSEILSIIENEGYSRIPIYNKTKKKITGIIHSRDFLLKYNRPDFKLEDIIVSPVFVPTTQDLDTVFTNMQKSHNHIVIVIDEYGETAGIVTMEDILEELVGEIWDERDNEFEAIISTGENTYRVLSSTNIDDFLEYFSLESDEDSEATTVNGWLTEKLKNIPKQGDTLEYQNLSISVTKADTFMSKEIVVKVNTES